MSGFYEGGYSGGGYSGGGGNNTTGSGYNNNNYNSGGNNAFSGGIGSSSSYGQQQTQPTGMQQQSSSTQQQQYNQQPQQQQFQPQQSQQPAPSSNAMDGAMNFWNPALTMAAQAAVTGKVGDSSAMMNVAESMGKDFLQKGWAKAIPGLERSMIGLRPYFAVDNGYVKRKMIKVLFPFIYRDWARQETMEQTPDGHISYALPIHDQNAPDLYIPSMALLTYVLLCALCYGNAGKFDPEVLPDVLSKCLVSQILEVIAIRIGFYMMVAPVSILDLLSYTGYKYLGLSVNMLSGLTMGNFFGLGHRSYYFTYLWTATAVSYFILKVMANCIPRRTSAVGPKRQFMVLGFAGSQFATCWFVSQTKFLE